MQVVDKYMTENTPHCIGKEIKEVIADFENVSKSYQNGFKIITWNQIQMNTPSCQ